MRIDPDKFYRTTDPLLVEIASKQTFARWRCEGKGPPFVKAGSRVLYRGQDILDWLEARTVSVEVVGVDEVAPECAAIDDLQQEVSILRLALTAARGAVKPGEGP